MGKSSEDGVDPQTDESIAGDKHDHEKNLSKCLLFEENIALGEFQAL